MTPIDFITAARVPDTLQPQVFRPWSIERDPMPMPLDRPDMMFPTYTLLRRLSWSSLHQVRDDGTGGEIVMEDSPHELRKHLPIWLAARGRVLVTGLGLGCVVRGLLASPRVSHVDAVEIDPAIIRVVGAEFAGDPRVTIHEGDALSIEIAGCWVFGWHDLWTDGDDHLQRLHARLFFRFRAKCRRQGAWAFPPFAARLLPWRPLGAPRRRPRTRRAA